ncbi:ABC transporter substrate-binding protein [Streptomyces sp. NPDC058221]|uniref:ABC transporter substrate-binding protein n=1 Tax=Streptomyces sp. NPDC058221 TaxID=3346388 RepID=UPI0036ECCB2A
MFNIVDKDMDMTLAKSPSGAPSGPSIGRRARVAVAALALAAALAACGSGGGSDDAADRSAGLKGDPVVVGLINAEQGPLTYPDVSVGASAAIRYVNENGGVNGRPLELVVCKANGTAESTIACAQELISKKAVVSLEGFDPTADAKLAPLKKAGIPVSGATTLVQGVDVSPDANLTSVPWSLSFPAALKALDKLGTKNLVIVGADPGPQMLKILSRNVGAAAGAMGMKASLTAYNPGSPNFAAAVTAAKAKGADAIYISGNEAACTNGVKTARQLGYKGHLFVVNCTDFASELGAVAKGVISLAVLVPPTAEATAPAKTKQDIDTYKKAMKADGSAAAIDSFAIYGFSDVTTFAEAVKGLSGEVTAATAGTAVKGFKGDVFLGQSGVDCTRRPVPDGGSCGTRMAQLEADGKGGFEMVGGSFFDVTK